MGNLVLTRRAGESVQIGESLTLTVREVRAAKVYLMMGDYTGWLRLGESLGFEGGHVAIGAINRGIVRVLVDADQSIKVMRTELMA